MSRGEFRQDRRAIESMPIKLVIASVVGVVALGLMLGLLADAEPSQPTEVTFETGDSEDLIIEADSDESVTIFVVDENGREVGGATAVVSAKTARVSEAHSFSPSGNSNEIELTFQAGDIELFTGQQTGRLKVEIVTPTDSNWVDTEPNPEIVVVG